MRSLINQSVAKNIYTVILACIAWFAIVLQLCLTTGSVTNFFSYFTILSNLLVAISLSFSFLWPASKTGIFFSGLSVQSAIALYIFIVGIVYNFVLRGIESFTGWQLIVDNLLHVVVPVLYVLYWVLFRSGGILKWRDGIYWIYFPLIYLIYSLIRGAFIHWYPYPFLNAAKFGYGKVFLNIAMIIGVFLVAGLLLIVINRSFKKIPVSSI